MNNNYYMEQLVRQQDICRISRVLGAVFLGLALVLQAGRAVSAGKRKGRAMGTAGKRKAGKKYLTCLAAGILLAAGWLHPVYAASTWASMQIVQGTDQTGGGLYQAPVSVQVYWRTQEGAGSRDPLRVSCSTGAWQESLEVDPGYGTSVAAQLQSLGISWLNLTGESGMGETEEGKTLQFAVSAEGSYTFSSAGSVLSFSVGTAAAPASSQEEAAGEPAGNSESEQQTAETAGEAVEEQEAGEGEESPAEQKTEKKTDSKAPAAKLDMEFVQGKDQKKYAAAAVMKISVKEENFDPETEPVVKTKVKNGFQFSGWKLTEEGAEASLEFKKDGAYSVSYQGTDLAGNTGKKVQTGSFILDRTNPKIRIQGVQNNAACSGSAAPLILVEDAALCGSDLCCTLTGARNGPVDVEELSEITVTDTCASIEMLRLFDLQDDVYTLSVSAADQAGNTAEEQIVFALDQEGSSYIFSDETRALMEQYYISEPIDLVFSETNTSPVVYQITVSRDGVPLELEEDRDYSVEVRGGDGDWMIYVYRIFASNFSEEGVYHVDVTSRDQASNVNNSQAKGARIDFAVDTAPPTLLVENLEEGAVYPETEHSFTVRFSDSTGLSSVRIEADGETLLESEDPGGKVTCILKEAEQQQTVQIYASDAAGNQTLSGTYHVTVRSSSGKNQSGQGSRKGMAAFCLLLIGVPAAAALYFGKKRAR